MIVVNDDLMERQVEGFALSILEENRGDKLKTLKAIWKIVREDVRYIPDGFGKQDIKDPARTWYDGYGDCKSMSVFIYFCCRALDIPCFIRFTSYVEDGEIGHVYPIAILHNKQVIVDAVYQYFDSEPEFTAIKDRFSKVYTKAKINEAMTQIRRISGIGSTQAYSRNQMQDITMTLQQKGKLTLPKSPRYNLSGQTEGVILAQLKAEKHNKLGLIATARGDQNRAGNNFRMRDQFANLGQPNLHQYGSGIIQTTGLDNYSAAELKKFANRIQRLEKRATNSSKRQLRDRISGNGIYGPYDVYEPNSAQLNQCNVLATERILDLWGNIDYEAGWNFNQSLYDTCKTGKYMENLVNAKLAETGSSFLLYMNPRDIRHYNHISNKRDRQSLWAQAISQATGLSESIIQGFFDNGIVDDLERDASEANLLLKYAMTPGHTNIGEPLTVATVLLIKQIIGLVLFAVTASATAISQIKSASEHKKENAFGTVRDIPLAALSLVDEDFITDYGQGGGGSGGGNNNGGGGGNSDGGGGLDPTTMLLLGLGAYVALK